MRAIVLFVVVTYCLAGALGLVVGFSGGPSSPYVWLGFVAMLIPAAAVGILSVGLGEGPRVDWRRLPIAYAPVALLLIPLVLHATMLPVMHMLEGGGLPWASWLAPAADGLYHTPPERGWGVLTSAGLARRIATNLVVGVTIVSILAFFEEVGWRGWLLPRLEERFGPRRAVIATAVIAALWHTPYALSGIHHIDGVSALQLALFAPFGHVAAGVMLGWIWLRSRSIWIVSLAHGGLNNWGQLAFKYMDGPTGGSDQAALAIGMLALLVVGGVLLAAAPGEASRMQAPSSQGPG